MSEFGTLAIAIAGGVFPALAWLWFWHREDAKRPEPRHLIALAFLVGMVTVAIVIPVQKFAAQYLAVGITAIFIVWSFIEEIFKYLAARFTVLRSRHVDEPIDTVMYMVTIALGFAAIENALFLITPITGGEFVNTVLTGNFRFIGATLLHVVSSAVVGLALAISFYQPARVRRWWAFGGVILAALLHSTFNFLILRTEDEHLFRTFALVWVGVVVLLAALEIVKRMKRRPLWLRNRT